MNEHVLQCYFFFTTAISSKLPNRFPVTPDAIGRLSLGAPAGSVLYRIPNMANRKPQ
jgi:hypothetical protein